MDKFFLTIINFLHYPPLFLNKFKHIPHSIPQNFMEEEKRFHMNLLRLASSKSAITIDFMLETLTFISHHSVDDALFIEEAYLGKMFQDKEFMEGAKIITCSVPYLSNRFEEAKRNEDVKFLRHLQRAHRESCSFLTDETIRSNILAILEERKKGMENKAMLLIHQNIQCFLQEFPNSTMSKILQTSLSQMIQPFSVHE